MRKRAARRDVKGGSLAEILVSLAVFMIAMGAMFVLFQQSYQGFHFLEQRQSVQAQVLRISSALETDFRLTHYSSVGVQKRPIVVDGESVDRDLTSCLTLDDWGNPANFLADTGIPIWNRHVVYSTSLDAVSTLERVVLTGNPPGPIPVIPLGGLTNLPPAQIKSRQTLCVNVLSWSCSLDPSRRQVVQLLRLRKRGAQRGLDSNVTNESFEARFRWSPKNTVPKL